MACAVTLLFFNKAALSGFHFPNANLITLLQLICSNVILFFLRSCNALTFTDDPGSMPPGTLARNGFVTVKMFRKMFPLSVAYMFYMLMSMASVRGVNLPMYTTLRRTTAAFTMFSEYMLVGRTQSSSVVMSVMLMVGGAALAGSTDLHFDTTGYVYVFANNLATAVYLAFIARMGKTSGLNSFGMMWCNGCMCAPLLLTGTFLTGELSSVMQFEHLHSLSFQAVLFCSCVLAFALNYSIFLNTSLNSALTQTICGNLKDVVVIIIGYQSFGGVKFDPVNCLGIFLGCFGSVAYAVVKLKS